jgi:hypothetical protein
VLFAAAWLVRGGPLWWVSIMAVITAFIGLTVAIAVKAAWWWPFAVILAVTGFAYLLGLSNYGVAEEGTPDDADAGHPTGFPVSF